MPSGLKRTFSHASIYAVGNVLQSAAGFVMLPIYTRYLTPADYGAVSMMQILLDVTALMFGMQIATAVFRHYFQEKEVRARNEVLATALGVVLITKGTGAIALSLLSAPASLLVFGQPGMSQYVALFAFSLLTDSLEFIPMQYLRILERPWLFVTIATLKLLLQIGLNLLFVVKMELGLLGVIYTSVLSGSIVGGALSLWLLTRTGLCFRPFRALAMLKYTWPLIGTGLLAIGMSSGSRLVLTHFQGLATVGLLALGAQFASVMRVLVWQPFNQVWAPQRFRFVNEPDAPATFARAFRIITSLLLVVGTAITLLSPEVLLVMSSPAFAAAASVVPMLVLGEIARCMTLFANTPLLVADRTVEILRANIVGAAVLVAALAALVPAFGLIGAAWATTISAFAILVRVVLVARTAQDLSLPWGSLAIGIGIAAIVICAGTLVTGTALVVVAAKMGLLLVFIGCLWCSPLVGPALRKHLTSMAVARLRNRG